MELSCFLFLALLSATVLSQQAVDEASSLDRLLGPFPQPDSAPQHNRTEDEGTGCHVKGSLGAGCQNCDTRNNYFMEPAISGCAYAIVPDYYFTFSLRIPKDENITAINFKSRPNPSKADVDVDFSFDCKECVSSAKVELFHQENDEDVELLYVSEETWRGVNYTVSSDKFVLENSTFYVRVSEFQTPLTFGISFAQHPKLDLIELFVSGSSALRHLSRVSILDSVQWITGFNVVEKLVDIQNTFIVAFNENFDEKQKEKLYEFLEAMEGENEDKVKTALLDLVSAIKKNPLPRGVLNKLFESIKSRVQELGSLDPPILSFSRLLGLSY